MTDQLTSRALALVSAAVNLVVCAAVVALLVVTNKASTPAATSPEALPPATETVTVSPIQPPTTTIPTTVPESSAPAIAATLQQVSGPGGMTTAVPVGWPSTTAPGPGALQATDPADSLRFLRYGGSPVADQDSYDTHAAYERDFAKTHKAFVSIRLDRTTMPSGAPAIDWEFEWDSTDGRRHVRSMYWRAQGHEYFVYASSLVGRWPQTQPILHDMIIHATP